MARSTKIYGKKLAQARERVFLTQTQLGQALDGMSDENISRIERSEVSGILSKHMPKLAGALKMSPDQVQRELVAPSNGATPRQDVERLWGRLFAAAQAVASATKKTRLQVLTEAMRRESMPSKMKLVAKPLGPRGPQP